MNQEFYYIHAVLIYKLKLLLIPNNDYKAVQRKLNKGLPDVADTWFESLEQASHLADIDVWDEDKKNYTIQTDVASEAINRLHEIIIDEECSINWSLDYCMPMIFTYKPDQGKINIILSYIDLVGFD